MLHSAVRNGVNPGETAGTGSIPQRPPSERTPELGQLEHDRGSEFRLRALPAVQILNVVRNWTTGRPLATILIMRARPC